VTWTAADHRPVLAEQPSCDDVVERDREAGVKVGVGSAALEALGKQASDGGLPAAIGPVTR
jgi:hypothetical protein